MDNKKLTPLMRKQLFIYNIWNLQPVRVSIGGFLGYLNNGKCYSAKIVDITKRNPKFTVYRNTLEKADRLLIALYINDTFYQVITVDPKAMLSKFTPNNKREKTFSLQTVWPFCKSPLFAGFLAREQTDQLIKQIRSA